MEAHVELKSFGVVFVEHDEGCGAAGEARDNEALSRAVHVNCSNFILDFEERMGFSSMFRRWDQLLYSKAMRLVR